MDESGDTHLETSLRLAGPPMPVTFEMGKTAIEKVTQLRRYPHPDLDEQIDVLKGVLLRQPEGSDQFLNAMESTACLYDARFAFSHQDIDRDEAIDLRRELARVCLKDSARQLEALHRLSIALQARSFPERLLYDHIIQEPTSARQSYAEDDLDEIIATQKAALTICDPNHGLYTLLTGQLGSAMLHRTASLTELQHSIHLLRSACILWPSGAVERLPVLKNLACALSAAIGASEKAGATAEMLEIVGVHKELVETFPHLPATRVDSLAQIAKFLSSLCCPPVNRVELIPLLRSTADELTQVGEDSTLYKATANALQSSAEQLFPRRTTGLSIPRDRFLDVPRFDSPNGMPPNPPAKFTPRFLYFADTGLQLNELDTAVCSYLDYISTHPDSLPDDTTRRLYLDIGALFRHRYVNHRDKDDLDAAIEYHQAAWQLTGAHHDDFRMLSRNLEDAYRERYNLRCDIMDYTRSLKLGMWPMDDGLIPAGPQLLPTPMGTLPPLPPRQLESTARQRDFMIGYYRDMIAKSPSPSRHLYVELASSLADKFTSTCGEDAPNPDEILHLLEQIDATGVSPSERHETPPNRSMIYSSWYRRTGEEKHLAAAITHLSTGTIADRMQVLWERYIRCGDLSDLERAIGIGRRVRSSFSLGNAGDRGYYHIPLALCLLSRYQSDGDPADIEEVITLPHAPPADLAEAYLLRYERYGREEDLGYAFRVGEFEQCPDDYIGDDDELDGEELHDATGDTLFAFNRRAVVHCKVLLAQHALEGPGATDAMLLASIILSQVESRCVFTLKADVLHCRATFLMGQKPGLGEVEDAVVAVMSAIETTIGTDVRRPRLYSLLGEAYRERYTLKGEIGDIEASIAALQTCFAGASLSNPRWADYKLALGESLSLLSKARPDPTLTAQVIDAFRDAAEASASSLRTRYAGGLSWARVAAEHGQEDALLAYDTVMEIFPQFASLGLDVRTRHKSLIRSGALGVASAAAACAIQANDLPKAVEFLEHGRSVFWRQAMQLKNPMSTLAESEPELARRLTELARDLNISGFHARTEEDSKAREAFIIREGPKRRALVEEWERLIKDARQAKGCEDLLQLPSYNRLAQAASSSLVILLVATENSGYAIIVEGPEVPPRCLPLASVTSSRVYEWVDRLRVTLKQANREAREVFVPDDRYSGPPGQRNGQREEATLLRLLGIMWRDIVHPVLDFIGLATGPPLQQELPRVTWCPTGALALLPIHAAGIYQNGKHGQSASDYIVSSYTPALSGLLTEVTSPPVDSPINVLLVGQPDSPGHPPIPNVTLELQKVGAVVQPVAKTSVLKSSDATRVAVLTGMADAHITHLACHGLASPDPLNSAIVLHDGHLEVSRLMRTPLPRAKLVFLSACQTARLSPAEPDESINIASAMLSAGFQTAIATMWSISDRDAPAISEAFYRALLRDARLELGGAARALHEAVKQCQEAGMSPLQWAAFIHVGM